MTGAAITANLMRNNSFRVDSVQKLLGPHKFCQGLKRERQGQSETETGLVWERRRQKGSRPLSAAAVASFFIVADNE